MIALIKIYVILPTGMDGQTKPQMSALVKNLSLPTYRGGGGGWTNQATNECLGKKA